MKVIEYIKKNTGLRITAAVTFVFALTVAGRFYSRFVFRENDDFYMSRLAGGIETGVFESELYYIGVILGKILNLLYSVNAFIPWYSLVMEGSLFFVSVFVLCKLLKKTEGVWEFAVVLCVFSIYWIFFMLPQMISISFFVVSCAMSCAAIVNYFCESDRIKTYVISFLLLLAAIEIRRAAAVMAIPFAGAVFLAKVVPSLRKKKIVVQNICFLAVCCLAFTMNTYIKNMVYSSQKWEAYVGYSNARGALFDYYILPDYEENEEIYDAIGISENGWKILKESNHLTFNTEFNKEVIQKFVNVISVTFAEEKLSLPSCLIKTIKIRITAIPVLSGLIILLYVWLIYEAIDNKEQRKHIIAKLIMFYVIGFLAWYICVYRGRLPDRVRVSLYYLELCMLVGLILSCYEEAGRKKGNRKRYILFSLCTACIVICFGKGYLVGIKQYNDTKLDGASMAYRELEQYIKAHENYFYYLDAGMVSWVTEEVFVQQETCINQALMGGWLPRTPFYKEKYEQYGLNGTKADLSNSNVFLVFKDKDANAKENLFAYLHEEDENVMFVTEEVLETTPGIEYEIVRVVYANEY